MYTHIHGRRLGKTYRYEEKNALIIPTIRISHCEHFGVYALQTFHLTLCSCKYDVSRRGDVIYTHTHTPRIVGASAFRRIVEFISKKIYFHLEAFLMVCIKSAWWTPLNPTPFQGKCNKFLPARIRGNLQLAAQETRGGEGVGCEKAS